LVCDQNSSVDVVWMQDYDIVYLRRLWFVAPWLTHTQTQTDKQFLTAY